MIYMSDTAIQILTRLNKIGAAIHSLIADETETAEIEAILRLIVESAAEVVAGSSAVLYTYDEKRARFDPESRVSAEGLTHPAADDHPRPDGFGALAVRERRRVLSYEEAASDIHPAKIAVGARTMTCYPLIVHRGVLGVLYLYLHEDRPLNRVELLMMENFVNQAAMALYIARQREQAERRETRKEKELRRLRRAGMMISSRFSMQDTLEAILRMALEVMDAQYGIFRLVDKTGKFLVTRAFVGEGLAAPVLENLPINDNSIMGLVAIRREPIMISNLREDAIVQSYYPLDRKLEMRSELAVPLIGASGRLEGVLNLESPQINAFSKQDRYILQIFATQAVFAIQETRLFDALQELSALLLTQPMQKVFDRIVVQASDLLNVKFCLLWRLENDTLVLRATTDDNLSEKTVGLHNSLIGQAILAGKPITFRESEKTSALPPASFAKRHAWGSALIIPIIANESNAPLGALGIYTAQSDQRDFEETEWEKKVLALLGYYAALAIQNAARLNELQNIQEKRAIAETFAAVGDIAANLMHRLNNKVGAIPVRAEGIFDKCETVIHESPYLANNLREIERSALEAMEIVRENLFHLHPITLVPVSVEGSVRSAIADANLPESICVHCRDLHTLPFVKADHKRLALVILNLLENACDAMQGGDMHIVGEIHIEGKTAPRYITLIIQDNGPGISPHLQERIFEFTYSGHKRERPNKLGFGLWWVKTLITRFGGNITLESDGETGTTFILQIPRDEQET